MWRTALYLGKLHDSPYLQVIGVDGKAGADIMAAFAQLCAGGYLEGRVCEQGQDRLAYETENEGMGWYYSPPSLPVSSAAQPRIQYCTKNAQNPHTTEFLGDTMVE